MDENGDEGIDLEQVAEMLLALAAERREHVCELVACVDGHRLDDDAFLLTLALAVLRGPDELREHMLEVERVRERASGGAPPW